MLSQVGGVVNWLRSWIGRGSDTFGETIASSSWRTSDERNDRGPNNHGSTGEGSRLDVDSPLSTLTDKPCQPVEVVVTDKEGITRNRRHRGLRPFDPTDVR